MHLDVVTPEAKTFSDEIDSVVLPGSEGDLGILRAHAPLVTTLQPGELKYIKDGKERSLAVGGGIVEISNDYVSVLTDMAVDQDDIDAQAVEKALERARKTLSETEVTEDAEEIQKAIMQSIAQLEVHRRRKGK
ncbi:MAG: ATP synthase F1 subunit epsilon [Verrucomicrobiales bacterium]|nr:ATP synthase F1 subunit epsilon [Verrucomicrobiales bacterium]